MTTPSSRRCGLSKRRGLLPEIIDGTQVTHPLTAEAAGQTGLRAGTPVSLGYVDMVMTALGAGVYGGDGDAACSTVGSTGVHMRAKRARDVHLNAEGTGYVIALPVPGIVTQVQTNMAATLNIDWILGHRGRRHARDGAGSLASRSRRAHRGMAVGKPSRRACSTTPTYPKRASADLSSMPMRGPSFVGLSTGHRYADLVRAVVEGLGMAMRDCYAAMGDMPSELRLTGGAARSRGLRGVLSASDQRAGTHLVARGGRCCRRCHDGGGRHRRLSRHGIVHRRMGDARSSARPRRRIPISSLAYERLFPVFAAARRGLAAGMGMRWPSTAGIEPRPTQHGPKWSMT